MKNQNVKEHPILFSGPMVRAILEDRKIQTRRIFKFKETNQTHSQPDKFQKEHFCLEWCPYGKVGDHLWVRETWKQGFFETKYSNGIIYKADKEKALGMVEYAGGWKPSIHMPRWASRITLEITGIRVERLQDISGCDAALEGVIAYHTYNGYKLKFEELWEQINGEGSWNLNPWVWVLQFKKL